jgi:hypothetical protein
VAWAHTDKGAAQKKIAMRAVFIDVSLSESPARANQRRGSGMQLIPGRQITASLIPAG